MAVLKPRSFAVLARPMPGEEIEGWVQGWHREAL